LRFFAAFLLQEAQLRFGLDAFGDGFQARFLASAMTVRTMTALSASPGCLSRTTGPP